MIEDSIGSRRQFGFSLWNFGSQLLNVRFYSKCVSLNFVNAGAPSLSSYETEGMNRQGVSGFEENFEALALLRITFEFPDVNDNLLLPHRQIKGITCCMWKF